ncbi:MAG: histidinol-phosphatase [Solirubrobacterales bacterium]
MLTDYHVHLRPDGPDTPAERYFTAANAERYQAAAQEAGIGDLGVSEHIYRFRDALEVWQHPLWRDSARDDIESYCGFLAEQGLKVGIEADFIPGTEDRMAGVLDRCDFDYVLGSVHFLGDDAVDHEGYDIWDTGRDPEAIWRRYFDTVAEAARSGLFDILAHPDLVKVWGERRPAPGRDARHYYEPLVEAVAETGVVVEVSTAGLRKPASELYPGPALLEMLVDAGARFALSSDAHRPEDLGYSYEQAVATLRDAGVSSVCVFSGRRCSEQDLG